MLCKCALRRADVLAFAKTTLFHSQGGISLPYGLEGEITISGDALLVPID
jgi:hypothetical protein